MTRLKSFGPFTPARRTQCSRTENSGFAKMACLVLMFCAATALTSSAQTFTTLASFDSTNGAVPSQSLVQGLDGNFYGTVPQGGANNAGTIFKLTPAGALTTFYNFCSQPNCADGKGPLGALVLANDGNFYGTTLQGGAGGANGYGTVFRIDAGGVLTTLYSFCRQTSCLDGYFPEAGLIQGVNGNFYGTTNGGGTKGFGTVFEITPLGKLATLYSFCNLDNCGQFPESALIEANNGSFYGLTPTGGFNGWGTVFEITPQGKETTLYSFHNGLDGGNPRTGLMQAANGSLYGTTLIGGANMKDCEGGCGAIFGIIAGHVTELYSFCSQVGCTDGTAPYGGLVQATDGNFFGSTTAGGADETDCSGGCGTLFEITPAGQLTTLYSFCSQANCADGDGPYAGLLQATNGNFYGTALFGGTSSACSGGCVTVFRLSVGLGPFVQPVSTSGKVGASVIILGNNLTGTTSVSFNGTAATFTVVSETEITASIPAGATTGRIEVTTASRKLSSNVAFQVVP